ncbi:MAG: Bcr/CflA family efflux MFS transporter [Streptosporangiales bacterium]|nr:Bcr/CflA family efflux MFS transporter [Streptosporangiales bacterium]
MTVAGQSVATPTVLSSRSKRLRVIVVLGGLSALAPLSIDAYLPGLPEMTDSLQTTSPAVQLSLTGFVVGMSLGQLVIGPLSDTKGRRGPLIVGMAVFTLVALACAISPNIVLLDVLRFAQGFAGAAGVVIARAVVRDLFSGPAAARFFASLMLVNGLAPILAPIFGAQLLRWTSWRGVFVALAVIGLLLMLGVALGLPETLEPERRRAGGLVSTLRTFWRLGHDPILIGYALTTAFGFAAMFSYISGSSFVLQNVFGFSPQVYSYAFGANALGLVICAQISGRLAHRLGAYRLLVTGIGSLLAGGLLMLVGQLAGAGVVGVLGGAFLVATGMGFIFPNAMALAMAAHGKDAGAASAMLGVLQFLVGGLAAPLVGVAGENTAMPMAAVMAASAVTASLSWLVLVRRNSPTP